MSNEEKKRREEYKNKRMKLIVIQLCALAVLTLVSVCFFITYAQMEKNYYINYTENSDVSYKVYLNDNDFYDEEYLEEGQSYVAVLIKNMIAEFDYNLNMESSGVKYTYSYRVDAELNIVDQNSKLVIFNKPYTLVEEKEFQSISDTLTINEEVTIDYNMYNNVVIDFYEEYSSTNKTSFLLVSAHIDVSSSCDEFADENKNSHVISLQIPLAVEMLKIDVLTNASNTDTKILACDGEINKDNMLIAGIVFGVIDVLFAIFVSLVIYFTRDTHINYSIKIKKIVNSYKSFIQKINNVFDTTGYQVLYVDTINEMLEIRDTLSSPILMSENEDRTCTQFIITTNNKIVYIYEVKVDNYDEIYNSVEELPENDETLDSEMVIEPNIIDTKEENESNNIFNGHRYSYSFEARLILSSVDSKAFYSQINKFIREYGVKIVRSFKHERVYIGRKTIGLIHYRGNTLCLAFAPEVEEFLENKHKVINMSGVSRYDDTPLMMKVNSNRKAKYAIQLLTKLFEQLKIENKQLTVKEERIPTKSKKTLIKNGLIKTSK